MAQARSVSMRPHRRRFLRLAAGTVALPAVSRVASRVAWAQVDRAQAYPARPVRIVVGFAPGGAADASARIMGQWLSDRLGQQFVVENRPGASSNIATAAVVRAAPDGYTLLEVADANAFNATLYDKLSFNFIHDIVPVASIDRAPFVMAVNPSSPANTVAEFIAYAKANTGKINMGASGPGSSSQLYGELFKTMTGIEMAAVQYRGVGSALPDLMSGRLDVIFLPVATAVGQINAAKVRALGVTSSKRAAVLPDVPAIGDTVAGYEAVGWTGIGTTAKTPDDIVTTLNRHVNAALADATFKARLAEVGLEPFASTPLRVRQFHC